MGERVYVAMGSNHRAEDNMKKGVAFLQSDERVQVVAASPVYASESTWDEDMSMYLNAALALETSLSIVELKRLLTVVEDKCGRLRRDAYGGPSPNVALDLDILLYGTMQTTYDAGDKTRTVPHPDVMEKAYVALPLMKVAANVEHPQTGETIAEIAARLDASGLTRRDDVMLLPDDDA